MDFRFDTPFCRLLGIDIPIIQAPIGGCSTPALVAAVGNAGGLGMLAVTWREPDDLRRQLRDIRRLSDRPFGVNLVLAWPPEERLAICLEEGARVVSFFWGDPAPFVDQVHAAGALAVHVAGSVEEARRASEAGVDVVVAQGWEAGGHVRGQVTTLSLVPVVVDAIDPVPVLAAGGIADGRGVAAVLALGAGGAWIGTRFLLAEEAASHPVYRERLIAATATDTVYSTLFDGGWPDAPVRSLRNTTLARWEEAGRPVAGQRPGEGESVAQTRLGEDIPRYSMSAPTVGVSGDPEAMALYAGQATGLARRVQPAAAIVRELAAETVAASARVNSWLAASEPTPS